jgi:hypothetical protein
LFADDPDSAAGNFPATSDAIAAAATTSNLHLTREYLTPGLTGAPLAAARVDLVKALRTGQHLFNYVGHGGLDRLTTEGVLLSSDVSTLLNGPRVPVMTALTCLIGDTAYPTFSSIGENLVLQPDGGVAALYAPTWISYNAEAGDLGRYVWPQLAQTGGGRLGDRLLRGMRAYVAAGGDRHMLRFFALLGDPAAQVP